MTPIPAWVAPYIGLPYVDKGRGPDGWDCWGGVRMVFANVFGIELPDYRDAYTKADDGESVAAAVAAGLERDFRCIAIRPFDNPLGWWHGVPRRAGDLLIIRIAGRPWHCALMVTPERFLHWLPPSPHGVQSFSCHEPLDSPRWAKRLDGFWRCTLVAQPKQQEAA